MATQPQKILILAAIPQPHGLRLDEEIREIEDAIRRGAKRDLFDIKTRTAVRPQDIRRAIAEEKPEIVHFCGHGLENGSLLLEDDAGQSKAVTPQGLASLFKLHARYVDCVLLNACHSIKSAEEISKYINYAIGMNQPIQDKSAIKFSQGFYDGLGYQTQHDEDVFLRAFEEAKVAIELENSSQRNIPVLRRKTNINVNKSDKPMDSNTISAKEITSLAFSKILDKSEAKFTEDALLKIDKLQQIIGEKFADNPIPKYKEAFTALKQGSKDDLNRVIRYLENEMEEDSNFTSQIQALAQEIKASKKQENRTNIQNNYGNAKGLLATGGTNYFAENISFNR
ncbi:MAG: CHAT domain-containing protein [Cyanobacteria bacterium P01_A01_bin.84]